MPRTTNLEQDLLDRLERKREEQARIRAQEDTLKKQIVAERYRKQRKWEAQVGRLAWDAGFHGIFEDDLGAVEKLFARLTPMDLMGTPVLSNDVPEDRMS